ncbi:MAG: HNH endonuclease [Planctomycetes bacterium]|nr:HNH endonuclease [Planctomycetota bacterium]MBU1518712.1 HNH endonuclease [Planctomycetota bacterium]
MTTKCKIDYLMFKVNGRIVKVDPDIYPRIFNTHIESPKKYTPGITTIILGNGRYPTLVYGKKSPKRVLISRFVTNAGPDQLVDHRNRNPLDNRRCNLRIATHRQNNLNKIRKNSSGYIGVNIKCQKGKYACIAKFHLANGKEATFRLPDCPENRIIAAFARDKFVLQAGEDDYAPLNFPCFKNEPFRSFLLNENLRKYKKRN